MLRDRYRKWGINNKNKPQHRAPAKSRNLATQLSLCQSSRVFDLRDDQSRAIQELVVPRTEREVLDLSTIPVNLPAGSPHAALRSMDPRIHEIMNGLSHWLDAWVNFPFNENECSVTSSRQIYESVRELRHTDSEQAWRRLRDAFSVETLLLRLRRTRNLDALICFFFLVPCIRKRRGCKRSCMLWFLCHRSVQMLGPRHPLTLLWVRLAHGLPLTTLVDIREGIFRINVQRKLIIYRRKFGERVFEPSFDMTHDRYVFEESLRAVKRWHGMMLRVRSQDDNDGP